MVSDNIIYRWNALTWTVFLHSGTFDHTLLINHNADPAYQHVSNANIVTLLAQTHFHSNQPILDSITSIGSGQIITSAERLRIPSQNQFNALAGTSGIPSNINRYVTNQDTRLNTTRNPYVTVGPPGSLATFTGVDAIPLEDALVAIDVGSATAVKALEILPGVFNLGGSTLTWANTAPLLIEAMVPDTVTFQVYVAGIKALGAGGPLTVRGITFQMNDYNTFACLSERPNTTYEDCTFISLPLINTQIGVYVNAPNTLFRRCKFSGPLLSGILVNDTNTRIEDCTFTLSNIQNAAVHTLPPGENTIIDRCVFNSGKLKLQSNFAQVFNNFWNTPLYTCTISHASPAVVSVANSFVDLDVVSFTTAGTLPLGLLVGHRYYVRTSTSTQFNVSATPAGPLIATLSAGTGVHTVFSPEFLLDPGYSTRILGNMPQEFNQPYIGVTRTVGPTGSYGDYRSSDEVGFLAAIDDGVLTLDILPGNYTFNNTVFIPAGCTVKGTLSSVFTSATGSPCFSVSGKLENMTFMGGNTSVVSVVGSGGEVRGCTFDSAGTGYPLNTSSAVDYVVDGCNFVGLRSLEITNSLRSKVSNNYFNCSVSNFLMHSGTQDQIRDNFFVSTPAPVIGDIAFSTTSLIVEGNHFLGVVPSKVNTFNSVWQSNYPQAANNIDGIDFFEVDMQGYLQPLSGASSVSSIASAGSVSFSDSVDSSAITTAIEIGSSGGGVNTASGFTVQLFWTSVATTGNVVWEVSVVFRDAFSGVLGTAHSLQLLSARTGASPDLEDDVTFTFSTLDYTVAPTHVSFTVTRKGSNSLDTLTNQAHLLDAKALIPRN